MTQTKRQSVGVLEETFDESGANAIMYYVHSSIEDNNTTMRDTLFHTLATKSELQTTAGQLRAEIQEVRAEMKEEFANVRMEMKSEFSRFELNMAKMYGDVLTKMADLHGDLSVKVADTKNELSRWMIGTLITLGLAIVGLYFKK